MEPILGIIIFILSLIILTKGADVLVDGSADLARFLKVSPILVGLTIVAFGTSLPEFIVSLFAVLSGSADLSVGNIVGSNIANIGLVLGISALFIPLVVKSTTLMYEFPFMLVSSFLFLLLANDSYLFGKSTFFIGRIDSLILLIIFAIFIIYVYRSLKHQRKEVKKEFAKEYKHLNPLWKNTLMICIGIIMLVVGGKLFVNSASDLAKLFGFSEAFIGVTIVALGTSLPELFTSAVAAYKKEASIAIGNIVGSNIFNILMVLGIVGLIKPIAINQSLLFFDGMIMIGITLLFLLFATIGKNLKRWEGAFLLLSYASYIGWLVFSL